MLACASRARRAPRARSSAPSRVCRPAAAPGRRHSAVGQDVTQFAAQLRDSDGKLLSAKNLFKGKRVLLLGVPGAFTPVCTNKHLPAYADSLSAFKEHKIDAIACVYVST